MSNIPHIKDKIVGLLESECCRNDAEDNENNMSFVLCKNDAFDAKLLIYLIERKDTNKLYLTLRLDLKQMHYADTWRRSFELEKWIINPASSFSNKPINKILQRKNEILDFFTCCFFVSNPYDPKLSYTESTLAFGGDLLSSIKNISLSFEERTVNCGYPAITIEDFLSLKQIICNGYVVSGDTLSKISIYAYSHIAKCQSRRREEIEKKRSKKKIK